MSPRPSPLLALPLALLVASLARAQETTPVPGFELERLDANPGMGSLLVGSGETLPPGGLHLMLLGNYQRLPLSLLEDQDTRLEFVQDRVMGQLSGTYGVFSWLEVGAQLPVVLWQRGADLRNYGFSRLAPQGLGTPQVSARVGLLSQRAQQPVDLSLDVALGVPLGSAEALARDPGLRFLSRATLGGRMGWVRPALDVGVLLHPAVPLGSSVGAPEVAGPEIRVGVALSTITAPLAGELSARATLPSASTKASVEILGGVRYQIRTGMDLFALGGPGVGVTPGTPRFRVVMGLSYTLVPPPRFMFIDETPPRQLQLMETAKKESAEDSAGQGPKPVSVWELNALALADPEKAASQEPSIVQTSSGEDEEVKPFQPVSAERLVLRGTVLFENGSARLPDMLPLLDQVSLLLQELPDSATVLIEGHADNEGTATYKRALSMLRAKAVRSYLIERGVSASRLQTRAFGSEWPASTRSTEEGRRLNRRVEVIVLTEPPGMTAGAPLP